MSDAVLPDEFVLRALSGGDVKSGGSRLHWTAMRPRIGESEISVIRMARTTADAAKAHGIKLKGTAFWGFARSTTSNLGGLTVRPDEEGHFVGHAEIEHGFKRVPQTQVDGVPAESTPEYRAGMAHYLRLAASFCLFPDPTPGVQWAGADLSEPCRHEEIRSGVNCKHEAAGLDLV